MFVFFPTVSKAAASWSSVDNILSPGWSLPGSECCHWGCSQLLTEKFSYILFLFFYKWEKSLCSPVSWFKSHPGPVSSQCFIAPSDVLEKRPLPVSPSHFLHAQTNVYYHCGSSMFEENSPCSQLPNSYRWKLLFSKWTPVILEWAVQKSHVDVVSGCPHAVCLAICCSLEWNLWVISAYLFIMFAASGIMVSFPFFSCFFFFLWAPWCL